jgi:opacity protein-like surface antigen
MRELVVAFLVCSLTLFSSTVMAQDTNTRKLSYFGITAGGVLPMDLDSDADPLHNISLPSVPMSNGYMFGIKFGHTPEKLFRTVAIAMEVEGFMIAGTDIGGERYYLDPIGSNVKMDADISVIATMLNFLVKDPYGQFHPYGGFGLGWTWFEIGDATLTLWPEYPWPSTGTSTNSPGDLRDDVFGYQILLGLGVDLTDTLSLDFGYRYFRTEPEIRFTDGADLDVKMTYEANIFSVCLSFGF